MKIKVFGCHSLKRELYFLAAASSNDIELELLPAGAGREELQRRIDACHAERIIPLFGERMLVGLHSGRATLVVPKAHDCAHLLLGSAERYRRVFSEQEDSPRWLHCHGCGRGDDIPANCAIRCTSLLNPLPALPEGICEYVADLSLLRALLELSFDESQALLIAPGRRVIADPVEIIASEPA